MDEIQHEGELYISSKRASEITGYTKDYVGQLARGKKVKAIRVGRAWYVHERSIREQAGIEVNSSEDVSFDNVSANSIGLESEDVSSKKEISVRAVGHYEPRVKTHSLNAIQYGTQKKPLLNTWGSVNYARDDAPLFLEKKVESIYSSENVLVDKDINKNSVKRDIKPMQRRGIIKNVDGIAINTRPSGQRASQGVAERPMRSRKGKHIKIHWSAQAFAALVLLLAAGSFGFLFLGNEWEIQAQSAASFDTGAFDFIFVFFGTLFSAGVALIGNFVELLFASLGMFFDAGLAFLISFFQ